MLLCLKEKQEAELRTIMEKGIYLSKTEVVRNALDHFYRDFMEKKDYSYASTPTTSQGKKSASALKENTGRLLCEKLGGTIHGDICKYESTAKISGGVEVYRQTVALSDLTEEHVANQNV